mmetsp:Transcript_40816/g.95762  ORF Transcript_40816/g.95762 Transcript_40816/m.95762 type:complete len:99 (+) Transcript_40816:339-635(+)|eukprot:CAMPEP_0113314688 /NCGR_PEP_ID=MMETSP0010_2-20120614/10644_1 /TAXON_ID=216773 ORGANISM="Corethron hystrix, Strain 308" /NCGR_SAMPLE_ID=MMETSP0010_2 /ASSEMBLY_ACC=CAM_ASM_000155 /LENGTH=98 /DNA_ID=CAMNT_0000171015 /DNA_START=119 /DNA_END=415 /DNA_ORIENTATION=+ /assembly_acc=CAM_ASM_000155
MSAIGTGTRMIVRKATPRDAGSTIPWIVKLNEMPRAKALGGAVGAFCIVASYDFIWKFVFNHNEYAPKTHNPAWAEATRAYLRFQNCNPIWGVSSEKK